MEGQPVSPDLDYVDNAAPAAGVES